MLESFDLEFRVIPFFDTDIWRMFTHGYASYSALGRWYLIFSSEIGSIAVKNKWIPVTSAETLTFKRSIRNFEKVSLRTSIACWDQKNFYIRQLFIVKGEVRAIAITAGAVRGPLGNLSSDQAFKIFGTHVPSPPMPKEIQLWKEMQGILRP